MVSRLYRDGSVSYIPPEQARELGFECRYPPKEPGLVACICDYDTDAVVNGLTSALGVLHFKFWNQ